MAIQKMASGNELAMRVTFRLDQDRLEELASYAHREGFTVSVIVRHLVSRFLEDRRRYERVNHA